MDNLLVQNQNHEFSCDKIKEYLKNDTFLDNLKKISYGNDLEFEYYDFKNINTPIDTITSKQIFKYNFSLIIAKLTEYFTETNINLYYNFPNRNEFILKDYDATIRNDVYVQFNIGMKYFECGFDFVEKTFNIDQYKHLSSSVHLDYYKYFDEDYDNINIFMSDCIYRMLIILCSLNNNEYKLAEILFIKSNNNLSDLKIQLEIYKKIIYGKKNKFINLHNFYEEILPVNIDTGTDMSYKEFQNYIKDNIFNGNKINLTDNNLLSWDDFELIIMDLDKNISLNVGYYKKVYTQSINTLILALKTINELIQQINKTKKYIPQYIQELILTDITNIQNKELLADIYKQLENYFSDINTF